MTKLDLTIEGMHCESCAAGVEMFVSQMEGIASVQVGYETKKGVVEFDPQKINAEQIVKAVEELGYKASSA